MVMCSLGDHDHQEDDATNEEEAHDGRDDHDDELCLRENADVVQELAAGLAPRGADPFHG